MFDALEMSLQFLERLVPFETRIEIVTARLACLGLAVAFHDGMALLLASARRSHPRRDHKTGRLQTRLVVVGERPWVTTYECVLVRNVWLHAVRSTGAGSARHPAFALRYA